MFLFSRADPPLKRITLAAGLSGGSLPQRGAVGRERGYLTRGRSTFIMMCGGSTKAEFAKCVGLDLPTADSAAVADRANCRPMKRRSVARASRVRSIISNRAIDLTGSAQDDPTRNKGPDTRIGRSKWSGLPVANVSQTAVPRKSGRFVAHCLCARVFPSGALRPVSSTWP